MSELSERIMDCESVSASGHLDIKMPKRVTLSVHRDVVDQNILEKSYRKEPCDKTQSCKQSIIRLLHSFTCSTSCLLAFLLSKFPVMSWLPHYNLKTDLISDTISGLTVSILHIPQGMAYGMLASVDAVNGLYVSFFPVLIYIFLGTSRHISVGTFAVVSLMLRSATSDFGNEIQKSNTTTVDIHPTVSFNSTINQKEIESGNWHPSNIEILTVIALLVGLLQVIMGMMCLGALSVLLTDQLVSAFSVGAAVHVATSQLKELFGLPLRRHSGPMRLLYTYHDLFAFLRYTNPATTIIGGISIFILALVKVQINSRFLTKLRMPIPIELIVVSIATVASHFGKFNEKYGVRIIGDIPTGLPSPTVPRLNLMVKFIAKSIIIAAVSFIVTLSLGKIMAKKNKYNVDPNQELLALGFANIFSSFFCCFPCSASISRSLIQERTGGKTQVAGLVSCCVVLLVLLFLSHLFYTLPKCILSSIILVALKEIFLNVRDFMKAWRISYVDAAIWLVTFISVVVLDVDYGLLTGVIFSLLTVIFRSFSPYATLLGNIPDTDIYLDLQHYSEAKEVPGIKIFHFGTSLHFLNREVFRSCLNKYIFGTKSEHNFNNFGKKESELLNRTPVHYVILDCSAIAYLDSSGANILLEIINEYNELQIKLFCSGCAVPLYSTLEKSGVLEKVPYTFIFPTIHDAALYCQSLQPSGTSI